MQLRCHFNEYVQLPLVIVCEFKEFAVEIRLCPISTNYSHYNDYSLSKRTKALRQATTLYKRGDQFVIDINSLRDFRDADYGA